MIEFGHNQMNDESKMLFKRIVFRTHAIQRMFQRHISIENVLIAIRKGEVIEDYPNDTPYPSRLILYWIDTRPIHVVCAFSQMDREEIVITVYEPDVNQWEDDYKRRKI